MHNEQNERQPLNQGPGKLTDYMAIQIIYKTHKKRWEVIVGIA